jgi:hypothetical protein
MPILKTLALSVCCALMIITAVSAHARDLPPLQAAQSDSIQSDEKFDSFIDQLISRIQSDIEQSINRKAPGESEMEGAIEASSDSGEVITGDHRIAHGETVDGDIYLRDGTLYVEGLLRGNATVMHGDIRVLSGGRITGDAHAINGSIYREPNGIIEGDIHESTSGKFGFFKRYLARHPATTFPPRWLHENLYVESPIFRYNRVEGVYLGMSSEKKFYWDGQRIISGYGSVGYGFLTHRWRGQLGLDRQIAGSMGIFELGIEGHNLTDTKDDWLIGQTENTMAAFFFRQDYRDYFQRAGFSAHTAWYTKAPDLSTMIDVEYKYDDDKSLVKKTNWSLFRMRNDFRENPAINDGLLRSIEVSAGAFTIENHRSSTAGWNTFAQAEFGGHDLGGDFSYTRLVVDVRRFQPLSKYDNVDVRLRLGSLQGDAIVQKAFELGGISTLPAFGFKEFAGNRMLLGNLEYALNGNVFDDLSFWPGFMTMIVFADAGDTRIVDTGIKVTKGFRDFSMKALKSDIGFALGWHDGTARLGFAWRTDKAAPPMVFLRLSRPF